MPAQPPPPRHAWAPALSDLLSYFYQPILPFLKKIKIHRHGHRQLNPADILLPEGYAAEVVATGFDAPVQCCFDPQGNCYLVESGHKTETAPRVLKLDTASGRYEVFYTLPDDKWIFGGAMTGACWHEGFLYLMNTDTLLRIGPDGQAQEVVTGLAGRGDHQSNHPIAGPDGKIYFGQGCATNCGVVGPDNFGFEWLPRFPDFCDVPAEDITLVGRNYKTGNILGDVLEGVYTGAYVPFGTPTVPNQAIKGRVKCSGAVLRCNPDGTALEVVAWGLRNPYSLAFAADGRLFATEHGMDERGARFILDDPDDLYEIRPGEWYGWPDFASGIRLDDPHWGTGGRGRAPILAHFPNPEPPKPFTSFGTHVAANGLDFSPGAGFGFEGDAFVACFGDLAPITTVSTAVFPHGFKVVRVNMQTGEDMDFAVNRRAGPGSKLLHGGFERPSYCKFGPDGALYVVDFGVINLAPEAGGIRERMGTGTLWRIRRTGGPQGLRPPQPVQIPIHLLQGAALLAGALGLGLIAARLLGRLGRAGKRRR